MPTLGQNIAALREARGLTQSDLARLSGVKQPNISKIEHGLRSRPGFLTVQRLAVALGVSTEELQKATAAKAA